MAARSVTVTFTNNSTLALVRNGGQSSATASGTPSPPLRIEAGTTVSWESESDGVAHRHGGRGHLRHRDVAPGQTGGQAYVSTGTIRSLGRTAMTNRLRPATRSDVPAASGTTPTVTWVFDALPQLAMGSPMTGSCNGVTIDPGDGSGPSSSTSRAMGADVSKPDIFVQLDHMADSTHSHALSAAAIKTVVDAFANSPYVSRNGSVGINLHVDAGPTSILNFATGPRGAR